MLQRPLKQSGTALLMALMLMTLAAVIATSIAFRQQISIKRTEQVLATEQAELYVQAVNDWAAAKLLANGKAYTQNQSTGSHNGNAQLLDTFPMEFDEEINGLPVTGTIIDAQGFFNLNTLSSNDAQTAFTQLIRTVEPDIDKKEAAQITQAVYQWVTPLNTIQQNLLQQTPGAAPAGTTTGTTTATTNAASNNTETPAVNLQSNTSSSTNIGGSQTGGLNVASPAAAVNENKSTYKMWDDTYLHRNPPYNIPHLPMASASELRLVYGVTRQLYSELAPFIIALPNLGSQVNVNTAPAEVLAATAQNLSLNAAKLIVDDRTQKPFPNLNAYESSSDLTNASVIASLLTTQSQYFLVKARVTIGEQHLTVYTLMLRTGVAAGSSTGTGNSATTTGQTPNPTASISPIISNTSTNTSTTGTSNTTSNSAQNTAEPIAVKILWQSIGTY